MFIAKQRISAMQTKNRKEEKKMNNAALSQLVIIAVLVEGIWENIKRLYSAEGFDKSVAGSLGVSILVCVATGADLFVIIGLPLAVPFLGSVLTGIITARGANFVNDLFTRLNGPKKEA
jgi:hypothetical protein